MPRSRGVHRADRSAIGDQLQQLSRRLLRTVAVLALFPLAGLLLVWVLVFTQAQRDEARRVDAIVVLYAGISTDEYLKHAVDLHQQGYATRLVLAGEDVDQVREMLINRGLPDTVLITVEAADSRYARMHGVADALHTQGLRRVLLVNDPEKLLLDLKMAGDLGLSGYGSPLPDTEPTAEEVLQAGLHYWQYVLLGME